MGQPPELSGSQQEKLHKALLSAFPSYGALRQMVQFQMDQNLDHITNGPNSPLEDVVFNLIEWAKAKGRTQEMIEGAQKANPGNEELAKCKMLIKSTPSPYDTQKPPSILSSSNVEKKLQLENPKGAMSPVSPYYIERPGDELCQQAVLSTIPFTLYIQAPRQMGKSSLLKRVIHFTRQASPSTNIAFIDFELFSTPQLNDAEEFLIEFCCMIGDALNLPEQIDIYWTSRRRSPLIKCRNYLFKYLVSAVDGPIILVMDEMEKVLGTPFQNDFFGMLRTWHNDRASDANCARVSLLLSSSTEPELFIENPNQSPFNVADFIFLNDFSKPDVIRLNRLHGEPLTSSQISDLLILTDGHPYLTRELLYQAVTSKKMVADLLETAADENGPFRQHLHHLQTLLGTRTELVESLRKILRTDQHPLDRLFYRLHGAGLVKRDGDKVTMRNQLYARYFSKHI